MFESLFQYPTVLARHLEGPAADERQRFYSIEPTKVQHAAHCYELPENFW